MCPMADMYELRDRPQKGNVEKRETENFSRDEEHSFETRSHIKELAAIRTKNTIFLTRKENFILKVEEESKKPWYFTHV